jgi:hypothetical protein
MDETCTWSPDEDGNWHTQCGSIFCLENGAPYENGMDFCCYCGKDLIQPVILEELKDE